ncbi:Protein of unknown function DUF679 [Macleaya cordata]|uniref:DUF679 domain membrane protein 2 n=1 Tax=Macleaya cordata TaxID=56857 RepID=A0A200QWX3_MACCD|nr:Protein of unknown function DUF679 [Macleaya cordata]
MSLRPTTKSTKETTDKIKELKQDDDDVQTQKKPTLSQRALTQTLTSTANLANLLPTSTVLAFQFLTPIFTNNGSCDTVTRLLTQLLLLLLASSCFLASFTDSFRSPEGQVYYGFATFKGIWFFDCYPTAGSSYFPDLTKYKLRFIDGVHAVLSVLVFISVALKDKNVSHCFYPEPKFGTQQALNIVPVGIGLISSLLFVVFPTSRHGIGYPVNSKS